jgi:hypothetical protein
MSPTENGRVIFNEPPTDFPVPGKTIVYQTQSIDLNTVTLKGGILVKTLYLSVDPYFRGRLREPHIKSYIPAFQLGEPYVSLIKLWVLYRSMNQVLHFSIFGFGIALVLRSEKEGIKTGDYVYVSEMREFCLLY